MICKPVCNTISFPIGIGQLDFSISLDKIFNFIEDGLMSSFVSIVNYGIQDHLGVTFNDNLLTAFSPRYLKAQQYNPELHMISRTNANLLIIANRPSAVFITDETTITHYTQISFSHTIRVQF